MTADDREKPVAICEGCETVCAVWVTSDGDVMPVSSTSNCECSEPALRVLDAETVG